MTRRFDIDSAAALAHFGSCVAPIGDVPDALGPDDVVPLCGARATEERTVEGVVCPLCHRCALEIDGETDAD